MARGVEDLLPTQISSGYSKSVGIVDRNLPTVNQVRDNYRGILYKCFELRATAIATAMTQLGVQNPGSKQGTFEAVDPTHHWYKLLQNPNPDLSAYQVWRWASIAFDTTGRADFVVEFDTAGFPLYLWPVWEEFGHMQPVPNETGGIAAWKFNRSDGQVKHFETHEVIRISNPDPHTPYESWSLLKAAAFELDIDLWASVYRKESLQEGGYPEVYLSSDQDLEPYDIKQYQAEWRKYKGPEGRSGDIPVLGKGLRVVGLGQMAKDLDFIMGKRLTKTDILQIAGISEGMLSHEANRANAGEHDRIFMERTIKPRVRENADSLTTQLRRADQWEETQLTRITVPTNLVPPDPRLQADLRRTYQGMGVLTINEILKEDGKDGIGPIGDVRFVSGMLVPITQVVTNGEEGREVGDHPTLRSLLSHRSRGDYDLMDQEMVRIARNVERKRKPFVSRFTSLSHRLYSAMAEGVLNNFDGDRTWRLLRETQHPIGGDGSPVMLESREVSVLEPEVRIDVGALFDMNEWIRKAAVNYGPEVLRVVRTAFAYGADLVASEEVFSARDPETLNAIREVNSLSQRQVENTSRAIENAVREGLEAGETREEIRERLVVTFEFIDSTRSGIVGDTMTVAGWEAGQHASYRKAGVERHIWATMGDGKVRGSHIAANGQEVPLNKRFSVGACLLKHPGDATASCPGETIRCRCTALPVINLDE